MAHTVRTDDIPGRVLVVDDEELVRKTLRMVLTIHGFTVAEAVDGEDAVRKYCDQPHAYDLLLMDMDMPRLTGMEALDQIRSRHRGVKAILLSGAPPNHSPEGAVFLQKPFKNDELIRLVTQVSTET